MLLFLVNTPPDTVFPQTLKILLVAAICAVVSGIVITAVLFLVEAVRSKTYAPYRATLVNEGALLLEDTARRRVGDRNVKGRLFLTEQSLSFFASPTEVRRIPVSEILQVNISDAKRGEVTVGTTSMEYEVFSVSDARCWFDAIGDFPKN